MLDKARLSPSSLLISDVRQCSAGDQIESPQPKLLLKPSPSMPVAEVAQLELSQHQNTASPVAPSDEPLDSDVVTTQQSIHVRNDSDYLQKVQALPRKSIKT